MQRSPEPKPHHYLGVYFHISWLGGEISHQCHLDENYCRCMCCVRPEAQQMKSMKGKLYGLT
ncbi:hypothetical protein ZEAMMB73_Zm00001d047003 [Zea mays]|uniref:Uncharacterized protein n=1 Tax=Zea mays TaxID=4577 RepID=A0A1D6P5V3_MAIZE|nr:hypothetical protein ZEAMMB73_Zm00001d047003 [Zea mays]AQL05316.1 hypothetical protein ZEAMMB73_Zm00001d047003 [Zea mays]